MQRPRQSRWWRPSGSDARALACALAILGAVAAPAALAQQGAPVRTFAVEIRTGTAWDAGKPPGEQAHFRDHSANLRKLREQGALVLGARYSDKGFLVLQAPSEQDAHDLLRQDPSFAAKVFTYELHEMNVFYGGTVQPRRPAQ